MKQFLTVVVCVFSISSAFALPTPPVEEYDDLITADEWDQIGKNPKDNVNVYISKTKTIVDTKRGLVKTELLLDFRKTTNPNVKVLPNVAFEQQSLIISCKDGFGKLNKLTVFDITMKELDVKLFPNRLPSPFGASSIMAHVCNNISTGTEI